MRKTVKPATGKASNLGEKDQTDSLAVQSGSQIGEAVEGVAGVKTVDQRQQGPGAARERFEPVIAQKWVQP